MMIIVEKWPNRVNLMRRDIAELRIAIEEAIKTKDELCKINPEIVIPLNVFIQNLESKLKELCSIIEKGLITDGMED